MSQPAPNSPGTPLLQVVDVSVRFGGVQALAGVDLTACSGEITGLIGPNGAGKTTLFNCIGGLEKATQGSVHLMGIDASPLTPHRRARLGMARTFQRLELFGSLSVYDNILAGAEFHAEWSRGSRPRETASEILQLLDLEPMADVRADSLPTGIARLVEVARALTMRPRLLLLDEPASGLDAQESEVLADLLLRLAAAGLGVLLVEHDVDLVMRICSKIHVLDFGRVIASGTPSYIQAHEAVQAAYLGAEACA